VKLYSLLLQVNPVQPVLQLQRNFDKPNKSIRKLHFPLTQGLGSHRFPASTTKYINQ